MARVRGGIPPLRQSGGLAAANCGGCGKAGCADFAKSVVTGENPPSKCPVASQEQVAAIAKALGIEVGDSVKKVAVVFCGGDHNQEKVQTLYNGVSDCVSASLIAGGPKGCAYGCLGMGSCARACPFNAIEMVNGLAVVHPELCVGCGACVDTCPRNLIKLVPQTAKVHIYCSSPEKGAAKMKVCSVPCIGCRKCVKGGEEGQFNVDGFKVSVNYEAEKLVDRETNIDKRRDLQKLVVAIYQFRKLNSGSVPIISMPDPTRFRPGAGLMSGSQINLSTGICTCRIIPENGSSMTSNLTLNH